MDRFDVTYRIFAQNADEAAERASIIALENTVEIPRDVVPQGYIEDVVLGRVREVRCEGTGVYSGRIGYHIEAVGDEFLQFLNVVLGNASIFRGVRVSGITPNDDLLARFGGARFGIAGIRALIGHKDGLVCPVIKPQGQSTENLARLCYLTARAGADIVKEDHGLANQSAAPFAPRVAACAEAVARANAERRAQGDTTQALYFASLLGHSRDLFERAHAAKEAGAHGLLIIPALLGFDAIFALAQDETLNLPIMAHPSHMGPYVLSPDTGYDHGVIFGTLMRLGGADVSVFPNFGGRFGFTQNECQDIVTACRDLGGPNTPILPSPGGGMSLDRLDDMRRLYGPDCVYLLGGSLLKWGDEIGTAIHQMRAALSKTS